MKNLLREKLLRGEPTLGCWVTIAHPEIPEILSLLEFDWFLFDMEHAPITVASLESLLQATSQKITPIVRVPANDLVYIKQALDLGAHGVMIPMVNNREQAEQATRCVKYPPLGVRGLGARRASSYYTRHSEYLKTANRETMTIVQIETRQAVENFEEIIDTPNVDAWFVGPNDLAASLGHLGNPDAVDVQEAMDKILKIGIKHDIPGGTLAFSPKTARAYLEKGYKLIAVGSDDQLLISGASSMLSALKQG